MPLALRFLAFALLVVASGVPALAQDDETVTGLFNASLHHVLGWHERVEGTVTFLRTSSDGSTSVYEVSAVTAEWTAEGTTEDGKCTVSGNETISDPGAAVGTLTVTHDSLYWGSGMLLWLMQNGSEAATLTCQDGESTYEYTQGASLVEFFHVPTSAESGAAAFRVTEDGGMVGAFDPGIRGVPSWGWGLSGRVDAVELVIIPEGYEMWMPEGNRTRDTEPGNQIRVRAELRSSAGPVPEAESFRFDLADVSREPGATINWPLPHSDPSRAPDLRLTDVTRLTALDVAEGTFAEAGVGTSATATVTAYDYGGWGQIRVTATLEDGREIVGHLEGDRQYRDVRLPRRQPGSFIADRWLDENGVAGRPDNDDTDETPEGDRSAGDGLTLYEEYRGVREAGFHARLNPRKKDLFIANSLGARGLPGIALFQSLSGLDVHYEVSPTLEVNILNRVVNPNWARGAHIVDQHAVWLRRVSPTTTGTARPVGPDPNAPIRSPRDAAYVDVSRDANGALNPSHVAHELFHTVGVKHHGFGDGRTTWSVTLGPDGVPLRDAEGYLLITEGGDPVTVRLESGQRYEPLDFLLPDLATGQPPTSLTVVVGVTGGEHSGHENCVMRYSKAEAYLGADGVYYWTGDDREKGAQICVTPRGTGINAPSRQPRSRFGDSTRDGCLNQIHVSDR